MQGGVEDAGGGVGELANIATEEDRVAGSKRLDNGGFEVFGRGVDV